MIVCLLDNALRTGFAGLACWSTGHACMHDGSHMAASCGLGVCVLGVRACACTRRGECACARLLCTTSRFMASMHIKCASYVQLHHALWAPPSPGSHSARLPCARKRLSHHTQLTMPTPRVYGRQGLSSPLCKKSGTHQIPCCSRRLLFQGSISCPAHEPPPPASMQQQHAAS